MVCLPNMSYSLQGACETPCQRLLCNSSLSNLFAELFVRVLRANARSMFSSPGFRTICHNTEASEMRSTCAQEDQHQCFTQVPLLNGTRYKFMGCPFGKIWRLFESTTHCFSEQVSVDKSPHGSFTVDFSRFVRVSPVGRGGLRRKRNAGA